MTKDEALRLALEALEYPGPSWIKARQPAITAIKAALEAKDEAWEKFCDSNCVWTDHHPDCKLAQRTWVGLTDEEVWSACDGVDGSVPSYARAIEARLKEKNT